MANLSLIEDWIGLKIASRGSSKLTFLAAAASCSDSSKVVPSVLKHVSTSLEVTQSEMRLADVIKVRREY